MSRKFDYMVNHEPPWWFIYIVYGAPFFCLVMGVDPNRMNLRSAYVIGSISAFMIVWGVVQGYRYIFLRRTNHTGWLDPILLLVCLAAIFDSVYVFGPLLVSDAH